MRQPVLLPLAVIFVLTASNSCSANSEPVTVRQHVLNEVVETNSLFEEVCTRQHPELKAAFEAANAKYQLRITSILDALLETDKLKSLSHAEAPEEAIASSKANAAFMRNITLTLQECNQVLSDRNDADDETLRGVLLQMLVATKGLIDMNKLRKE